MNKDRAGANLMLFVTACIWGTAFVAQSAGTDWIGPLTFNFFRFLIGGLVLLPFILATDFRKKRSARGTIRSEFLASLPGGLSCGVVLCAASLCQQYGIGLTSVGKAGFITALYIVLVPVMGIFLRKKVQKKVWFGVLVAVVGFYLLCVKESLTVEKGDLVLLAGSVLFAVHIIVIDHFAGSGSGVKTSCIQFFVSALLCWTGILFFENPSPQAIAGAAVPILYAGVFSCGIAYTLQIVAQKNTDPAVASLILSLESVVAAAAGWLILGQSLSAREIAGGALVFGAVILVQLPDTKTAAAQAYKINE